MGLHSGWLESYTACRLRMVVGRHSRGIHSPVAHTPENDPHRGRWCCLRRSCPGRSDRIDHRNTSHQVSMVVCQTIANTLRWSHRRNRRIPRCSDSLPAHYIGRRIARVHIAHHLAGRRGLPRTLPVRPMSHIGCRLVRRSVVRWACISTRPAYSCHRMTVDKRRPDTHRSHSLSAPSIDRCCCRAECFEHPRTVDCQVGKRPSRLHPLHYHRSQGRHLHQWRDHRQRIHRRTKQKSE